MCFAGKQFPGKRDKIRFANFTRYRGSREVHIDMFDDRIEITSPGGMFGGGSIQEYDIYIIG